MKILKRDPDKGYIDTWLWVPKRFVNVEGTKSALTFTFTDTYSEEKVRVVSLWKETDAHILVPRSFWHARDLPFQIIDARPLTYQKVNIQSKIKLDHRNIGGKFVPTGDSVQQLSVDALLSSQGGVLQLACGKGKTIVMLEVAARFSVPTLIVVDNTQLLEQWYDEITKHLIVPDGVGLIQADKFDWKKPIVLSTYQTLAARAHILPEEVRRWFGVICWDEGHHIAAPTFARSADLFYGLRFALTATPVRDDGLHVIYDFHIGEILHKDLRQSIKPRIIFKFTNMGVDEMDTHADVRDKNGELHLAKIANYNARSKQRLNLIVSDIRDALNAGRKKILVLSTSIAEVCNLMSLWNRGADTSLFTDIPIPTNVELGETLTPATMTAAQVAKADRMLTSAKSQLALPALNPTKSENLRLKIVELEQRLKQHELALRIDRELTKRQSRYIQELVKEPQTAGLLTYEVKARTRANFVKTATIIFAIMKYGKEGMDCPDLDTVFVCEPFSQRNGLQQLLGRTTRVKEGKLNPIVVVYEDAIGPMIGMCKKLRNHLREWPLEEGGPFSYELIGHPQVAGHDKIQIWVGDRNGG